MSSVSPGDSTVAFIRLKVRRLTASSSESVIPTALIDQYINNVILNDLPYSIKLDQQRSVYTFFTQPYIDRYPLDVNYNQGVRAPVYVEGIQGSFFKDRQQFYNLWPRFPTKFQPISGDGSKTDFTFTIPGPFLSREVVLGGVDVNGNAISVNDDGFGNLRLQVPNPVVSKPLEYNPPISNPAVPGMKNLNTGNPGLDNVNTQTLDPSLAAYDGIGNVDYVTGVFNINFPVAPASGQNMNLWVSQYVTGRPYCLLFWNNEFTIRPVPKIIHKVEVETYLTPVQFLMTSDTPILSQWAQYVAYLAAQEILRDRQDMAGVQALEEGKIRQEELVLQRQSVEDIFTPNVQLWTSTQTNYVNGGFGQGSGIW